MRAEQAVATTMAPTAQTLATKLRLARGIKERDCRAVFTDDSRDGKNTKRGSIFVLVGKEGGSQFQKMINNYLDNNAAAPLAPLLATLKGDVERCYVHLDTEQDEVRETLSSITVDEPTFSAPMPQHVKDRIKNLLAFRETTEEDKYPQLRDASLGKWRARCAALYAGGQDINAADMPPEVDDGFTLNHNLVKKKGPVKTYQLAAQLTVDRLVTGLRDKYTEPSVDDKKQAMRDAFGVFFEKVVRVVEAHEEKAIRSLSSEEPALTEALTKRFGPRAEAAAQRTSDIAVKSGNASAAAAQEAGFYPGLAAARKENKKNKFTSIQTPTGIERAPNNMYPAYVAERIKAGFLESKNLVRAWTNHKPRRKRANM